MIFTSTINKKIMKRYIQVLIMAAAVAIAPAHAATVENNFFKLTTPDDSWFLTNDDALRPYGARVDIARMDARGATLELARIDYIEGAFDPRLYLTHQVVEKKDVFCRAATNITAIYDSYLTGRECPCVQFNKRSNGYDYQCEAMAYNVGYGTCMVIMAHRAGTPSLVARIIDGITFKVDTATLTTSAQMVAAAQRVVAKHHLPIGNNEHLSGVEMSKDSTTVTLTVTVPYITKENVNVPVFVTTKRDAWFKQAPEALKFNLLLAAITRERKSLRYLYVDTKGKEIGTLLIVPEEYDMVTSEEAIRAQQEAQEAARRAQGEARRAQEEATKRDQEEEAARKAQEAAAKLEQEKAAAQEAARAGAPTTNVVKPGDTLTKIASTYGVTIGEIKQANSMKNDRIQIGQKLTIPARK